MSTSWRDRSILVMALLATGLAGCTAGTSSDPSTTTGATRVSASPSSDASSDAGEDPTPTAAGGSAPPSPTPATATEPGPGQPCEPADGNPDCTDSVDPGQFWIVTGYADCLAWFGPPEAGGGLCADLDHDGRWGYPDVG